MTDMINRQDTIEAIRNIPPEWARSGPSADSTMVTIKQAETALSALPAVGGWLDIESVDSGTGHCLFYGATKHDGRAVFSGWVAFNGMCYTDSGDICHPAAYMPLPAPPVQS